MPFSVHENAVPTRSSCHCRRLKRWFVCRQLLAEADVPVYVFERTPQLEPRSRTLIVTPEVQRVLGCSVAAATVNTVHTLDLCITTRTVPISLGESDLVIERAELVRMLARKAEAAGAVLQFEHDFIRVESAGDRALVGFLQRSTGAVTRVRARAIIAADGARSHVARYLGQPRRPAVTVLQARVSRPPSAAPGVGKVWFLPRETKYFYWLCPESRERAAVGLVDASPRAARAKLDRFLAERDMQPLEYQSALIPLYQPNPRPFRRIGRTDIMFVGDAAGHVKVTTIGGSVTGLLGARAAAQALINGTNYLRELGKVERELRLHWLVRGLMNQFSEYEYDVLLQLLDGQVGKLLAIHNRDRMAGVFLPILVMQPRLPLLAAQVLWRTGFRP
jgi:flavin-dependent dehydrogenase